MSLGKFTVVSEDYVNVFISSNVKAFTSEKKFAKSVTIGDLKGKLELITGGSCLTMKVFSYITRNVQKPTPNIG